MKPAKLLGHHIHPMLIVFPLGLLAISVIFDLAYLASGNSHFAETSYWNILAGVIGGLAAAVFGAWDWFTLPSGTRAKRVGLAHGLTMVATVVLFAVSWLIRSADPLHLPGGIALTLSFVAVAIALVGGWLGGELVEKLGVGVASDAGLDAPSSLKGDEAPTRQGAYGRTAR